MVLSEFIIGSLSAVAAVTISNPLEVVKTRFQLQGELQKTGQYTRHYKNILHAFYIIAKKEGVFALQKGLTPAAIHQVLINGTRLGAVQFAEERKWNLKENGEVSLLRMSMISAVMGAVSAYTGCPVYMIKTRMQAQANEAIAVGHQHKLHGAYSGLKDIYLNEGVLALWRGVVGSIPRFVIGSTAQLTSFYVTKDFLERNQFYSIKPGLLNTFLSSMIGGVALAVAMGPFDTIATRLFNQGVSSRGEGLLYANFWDCTRKIWATEGFSGFYKGIVPCYFRVGPHTLVCFVTWDILKNLQRKYIPDEIIRSSSTN